MALVIVERRFDAPCDPHALHAQGASFRHCNDTNGVRFLRSFVSVDRRRMICTFEAPDAEAVRRTQNAAGLSVERAWSADVICEREEPAPPGHVTAVVERTLDGTTTLEELRHAATDPMGCGQRLRVRQVGSYVSFDRRRACCIYRTPDLESVRVANRTMGLPLDAVWGADEHRRVE